MVSEGVAVCFPYEFTLLSNELTYYIPKDKFVSPTNLHCSQTTFNPGCNRRLFVSPTNLHCSQTVVLVVANFEKFVSPTNLHCSQTWRKSNSNKDCLFPLRIYTALKHVSRFLFGLLVCFPYEFTLLSNTQRSEWNRSQFVSPTNLHCSQTLSAVSLSIFPFVSPTNLHCSQTGQT